jgi:polyvinyl alcohol dehydrogenase (cytochrome)
VDGNYLYFPDSAGFLYKVNKATGAIVWKNSVSTYTGIPNDFARATPAIAGNALILGNQSGKISCNLCSPAPAQVFAVDKNTGAKLWSTQVDDTYLSLVTQSAIVSDGTVYVGIASNEELIAAFVPKAYWTWSFRGSLVALDAKTGAMQWKTYMVPDGYYGGSIWGSTPVLDKDSNTLYVTTGDNFWAPLAAVDCVRGGGAPASCLAPDDYFDSIVAINAKTGKIKWGQRGLAYDVWNVGCGLNIPGVFSVPAGDNCPAVQGPDWDFGQGAMLFSGKDGSLLVGAGQKSGVFWAFKAGNGKLAWSTQGSPGGVTGGMQWGSAADAKRIFVTASNAGPALNGSGAGPSPWTLADGTVTRKGGWSALDQNTGAVLWTTAVPGLEPTPGLPQGLRVEGAPTVANGVLYGCALQGVKYAINAATGNILWSNDPGLNPYTGSPYQCNAGAAVVDGVVYWGSGTFNGYGPHTLSAYGL